MKTFFNCIVVVTLAWLSLNTEAQQIEPANDSAATIPSAKWQESLLEPMGKLRSASQGMVPTDKAIETLQEKVRENPRDAYRRVVLGRLYLRHAKETDTFSSYKQAEVQFQAALKLKPKDQAASSFLAQALLAQHRFQEALDLSAATYNENRRNMSALASLGDAQLELGNYQTAQQLVDDLAKQATAPAVLARQARLLELTGNRKQAVQLLEAAKNRALELDQTLESVNWYAWRLGTIHLNAGDLKRAKEYFEQILQRDKKDTMAQLGMARVAIANRETLRAIKWVELALKTDDGPPVLALMGDLMAMRDAEETTQKESSEWIRRAQKAMEEEAKHAANPHLRERAMFLLNHDLQPELALQLAQQDLKIRRDIYSYDTLAWAYYKNGKYQQAWEASQQAIALGTQDAQLFLHAGLIQSKLNQTDKAQALFETAQRIDPNFLCLESEQTRSLVAKIEKGEVEAANAEGRYPSTVNRTPCVCLTTRDAKPRSVCFVPSRLCEFVMNLMPLDRS